MQVNLEQFVENTFGKPSVTLLNNMSRGGNNNDKGNRLESRFSIYQIAKNIAETLKKDPEQTISRQQKGFVDDIVQHFPKINEKKNYQAKDSKSVSWNSLKDNFSRQYTIDTKFHKVTTSRNIALVASQKRYKRLKGSIPKAIKAHTECEFFPNPKSQTELLLQHKPLQDALKSIVRDPEQPDKLDAAFNIIHGVFCSNEFNSVKDIWDKAIECSHPDIFITHQPEEQTLDPALKDFLDSVQYLRYHVCNSEIKLTINEKFDTKIDMTDSNYENVVKLLLKSKPSTASDFIALWMEM